MGVGLLHRGRQKKRAGEQGAADEAGDLEAFAGLDAALAFSRLTWLVSRRRVRRTRAVVKRQEQNRRHG